MYVFFRKSIYHEYHKSASLNIRRERRDCNVLGYLWNSETAETSETTETIGFWRFRGFLVSYMALIKWEDISQTISFWFLSWLVWQELQIGQPPDKIQKICCISFFSFSSVEIFGQRISSWSLLYRRFKELFSIIKFLCRLNWIVYSISINIWLIERSLCLSVCLYDRTLSSSERKELLPCGFLQKCLWWSDTAMF